MLTFRRSETQGTSARFDYLLSPTFTTLAACGPFGPCTSKLRKNSVPNQLIPATKPSGAARQFPSEQAHLWSPSRAAPLRTVSIRRPSKQKAAEADPSPDFRGIQNQWHPECQTSSFPQVS